MGLDTYATRDSDDLKLNKEDRKAFEAANIELCGGILSGGGNDGSFRGKVYVTMIMDITGESLFQEWIPPETVRKMYESLMACDPQQAFEEHNWYDCSPVDILELRKFFKVCSERGLGLINWS